LKEIREINVEKIKSAVSELCIKANLTLPQHVRDEIAKAKEFETSPLCKDVLCDLERNIEAAKRLSIPVCQDTGMTVVFLEIGQDVHFTGGNLYDAVNAGVADGYTKGYLRKSVVADPFRRDNTGDNTPAVIHTSIVCGDNVKVTVAPKGFGSENMSRLKMFNPSATTEDIIEFVTETVKTAGSNPCPPVIIGVGIGGNFETSAYNAKYALLKETPNPDKFYSDLEERILRRVNGLGIGSQGFGGSVTALAVHIISAPTHIAGLPAAVNISCHVTRHCEQLVY
jgi:fumarate hydratase subunit alpha